MDLGQLDGMSAILGALAASGGAGVAEGIKDTAKAGVIAARDRLIEMLRRRFGRERDSVADAKLTVYLAEPTTANAEALRGHISSAGLDRDDELIAAARAVLQEAGPTAVGPGSVAARIINAKNTGPGHSHIGGVQVYDGGAHDPQ